MYIIFLHFTLKIYYIKQYINNTILSILDLDYYENEISICFYFRISLSLKLLYILDAYQYDARCVTFD